MKHGVWRRGIVFVLKIATPRLNLWIELKPPS